ncbi:sensor histidine kinase [Streptomyces sp. 891-h]|uniref:sensor histidine kinase n=1 Tax=Streptomyces sp. 891-h TaxID=2720714 RepID=UPI001FAAA781|nr:sensor histidine kinase [Streptomyces sp. 891-h]UNZ17503.1 sensor histidine kinase [Streptomyces sp. 891-h]
MTERRSQLLTSALTAAAGAAALLGVLTSPWWTAVTACCSFLAGRRPGGGPSQQEAGGALIPALFLAGSLAASMTAALTHPAWLTPGTRFVAVALTAGALSWCAGRFWRQYQELARAGWERAEQLARERELVAGQARLRERSRIAQDMHDALGHELSLLALSASALKLADGLSAEHRTAAEEIRGRAETAVDRLGEVIGVLRETEQDAPTRPQDTGVTDLVEEASAAGLAVTARIEGDPEDARNAPPPHALRAAHRVVQESLTNVVKHAPGATATVTVEYGADETRVVVENGPAAALSDRASHRLSDWPSDRPSDRASARPGVGGRGLIGLDERVRLAGGTFRWGPRPDGGFTVRATLPHTRASQPPSAPAAPPAPFQEQRHARRRLGRTALAAVTACLTLGALLGGALTWWDMLVTKRAVLAAEDFGRLRAGQQREQIAPHLPAEQTRHRPAHTPPPPQGAGTTCEFYAMTANPFDDRSGDVYRLCFRSDTLVSAEALRP